MTVTDTPPLPTVQLGSLNVSRLIIGGNPLSAISHQNAERDMEMRRYFTVPRIHQALADCERNGINTLVARIDNHICRMLFEYREAGGQIQWIAQTALEHRDPRQNVDQAKFYGANALFFHGGQTDKFFRKGDPKEFVALIDYVKAQGLPVGFATHDPDIMFQALEVADPDFVLQCFHNISGRAGNIHAADNEDPLFKDEDWRRALDMIRQIPKPTIVYKVLSAGRKTPRVALPEVYGRIKATDAVLLGMYPGDNPNMVAENAELVRSILNG